MLPSAYAIRTRGNQTRPCQRKGAALWLRDKKNSNAAPNTQKDTKADFKVSCSIKSLGTPTAGTAIIMKARTATDALGREFDIDSWESRSIIGWWPVTPTASQLRVYLSFKEKVIK